MPKVIDPAAQLRSEHTRQVVYRLITPILDTPTPYFFPNRLRRCRTDRWHHAHELSSPSRHCGSESKLIPQKLEFTYWIIEQGLCSLQHTILLFAGCNPKPHSSKRFLSTSSIRCASCKVEQCTTASSAYLANRCLGS